MPVPQATRDAIYQQVRSNVLAEYGTLAGQCLAFAWHGLRAIRATPRAPRAILQAGSCSWPFLNADQDDGVGSTHFTYEWDAQSPLVQMMRQGVSLVAPRASGRGNMVISLPEIHVWIACPETAEIIDFTTGTWPEVCPFEWRGTKPPDYLWSSTIPDRVIYHADLEAIRFVRGLLDQQRGSV